MLTWVCGCSSERERERGNMCVRETQRECVLEVVCTMCMREREGVWKSR